MANAQFSILYYIFSTVLSFIDMFASSQYFKASFHCLFYSYNVNGILLIAFNLTLGAYVMFFLPFHNRIVNIIASGVLSASTFAAIVGYLSTVASSAGYNPLIALVVMSCTGAVAGMKRLGQS